MDDKLAELFVRGAHHSRKRLHSIHRRFYVTSMGEEYRNKFLVQLLLAVLDKYCSTQISPEVWINRLNPSAYQTLYYYDHVLSIICSQISIKPKSDWPSHWFRQQKSIPK
jgi:hypothetical protein